MPCRNIPVAVYFIVVVEFCERLCYNTFQGTTKTHLQNLGFNNSESSSITFVFGMLSYIFAFFGGWLASTRCGLFGTIASLGTCYLTGTYMAAFSAFPSVSSVPLFLIGLMALVTVGSGGIKPNVVTIGANQYDPADPSSEENKKSFFQYFYLAINAGSVISHGYLSTAAVSGAPYMGVPVEYGYFFAYMVGASFMLIAILTFVSGKPRYRKDFSSEGKQKGIIRNLFGTIITNSGSCMGKVAVFGWFLIPCIIIATIVDAFVESKELKMLCLTMDALCIISLIVAHRENSWLPVGGVSAVLDCVPVIVAANVCYGTVDNSMSGLFQSSACQMNTRANKHEVDGFQFSGDFFRLGNPVAIVLWTPILDGFVYPGLARCLGKPVSAAWKITGAYMFMIFAQLIAALLEHIRMNRPGLDFESRCAPLADDGTHIHGSDMSAFWMMVPYAVSGISEIMIYPVIQHLAYQGSPSEMKPFMQAFCQFSMGALPSAVASAVSQGTAAWVPNNLNDGHLVLVYMVNCSICLAGLLIFWTTWRMAPPHVKGLERQPESENDSPSQRASARRIPPNA
jgi:peptide/histidine transporter 3/4